jgi:Tfp pilus assembly protein PilF
MSLLNKALRKRNKGPDREKRVNLFQGKKGLRSMKGVRICGTVILILIFIGATLGVLYIKYFSLSPSHQAVQTATHISVPSSEVLPLKEKNEVDKEKLKSTPVIAKKSGKTKKKTKSQKTDFKKKKLVSKIDISKQTKPLKIKEEIKNQQDENIPKKLNYILPDQPEVPFYQKALSYHRSGKIQTAIELYLEVLKKNPDFKDAIFNLVAAYIEISNFSKAYTLLEKLRDLDPENPQVLLNLSVAEIGLGLPEKAIFHLEKAELLKGPRFEIYLNRGIAFSQIGRLDEAIMWHKRAEEIQQDEPLLLFNMALCYDKHKKYNDALRYYLSFLKQGSSFPPHQLRDIKRRIRTLRVYLARQVNDSIDKQHQLVEENLE